MSKSLTHQTNIANLLRGLSITAPVTVYIGLFTTAPTEPSGMNGVEVSGGSYARQPVTFSAPVEGVSGSEVSNSADITFPVATADWGTVEAFVIFGDAVADSRLYFADLNASRAVGTTDQFRIPAGQLIIREG